MSTEAVITGASFLTQPILLAEDNEDDVFITRSALGRAGVTNPLHIVNDGEEAIAYLQGQGAFADRAAHPLPVLLLLDLNMPKRGGLEVLEWVRRQPGLRRLAVHILTASTRAMDVTQAMELGANAYLVKPSKFADLIALFQAWRQRAQFEAFALPQAET